MSNVKMVTECPSCKTPGKAYSESKRIRAYECPKCGNKWSTLVIDEKRRELWLVLSLILQNAKNLSSL